MTIKQTTFMFAVNEVTRFVSGTEFGSFDLRNGMMIFDLRSQYYLMIRHGDGGVFGTDVLRSAMEMNEKHGNNVRRGVVTLLD